MMLMVFVSDNNCVDVGIWTVCVDVRNFVDVGNDGYMLGVNIETCMCIHSVYVYVCGVWVCGFMCVFMFERAHVSVHL